MMRGVREQMRPAFFSLCLFRLLFVSVTWVTQKPRTKKSEGDFQTSKLLIGAACPDVVSLHMAARHLSLSLF